MATETETSTDDAAANWPRDHARRYLEARYGRDVWFRAPETFGNAVELWIWAVAGDAPDLAEEQIALIEAHFAEARR